MGDRYMGYMGYMKYILKNSEKIKDNYHFFNISDFINFYIYNTYPDKSVIVVYNTKLEFERITKFYILKRDNFDAYQLGLENEIVFVLFDDAKKAQDWIYDFPPYDIKWEFYEMGKLISKSEK